MIPSDHLVEEEHEPKQDVMGFLQHVTIILLNEIIHNAEHCKFLGNNDVLILRGTNVIVFCFSRVKHTIQSVFSEHNLSEAVKDEQSIQKDKAELFTNDILPTLEWYSKLTDPINIIFPISYLSLPIEEQKNKQKEIANLLLEPTRQDIEKANKIVRVQPIFNGRNFFRDDNLCFVLMPFKEPYNSIYEKIIKPTIEKEGFRCIKSNDIFSTTSVIEDIWANINKATLIIAEITEHNPNVMYELGICHTIGKDVMMITQQSEEIPFNFRHLRTYAYVNDITKADELKANISSMIQYIRSTQKK